MIRTKKNFIMLVAAGVLVLVIPTRGAAVYTQPPAQPSGWPIAGDSGGTPYRTGLYQSSWWDPDGSDYDQYVWDNFTMNSNAAITEIKWRGGYDPSHFGSGGSVVDFTISIWASVNYGNGAPLQPDLGNLYGGRLAQYTVGGNASETLTGTFGSGVFNGTTMYDYKFTLPTPFAAAAGKWYWVGIEASQHGIPDWGIAIGTGGDGYYFRQIANVGDIFYQHVPGDAAFTVLPEPSAFLLLGSGVLILRRKHS